MSMDFDEGERLEEIAPLYFLPTMKGVEEKFNKFEIQEILPLCKGPNILELGCGEGLWTEALLQIFDKITIVDASRMLIKNIQTKFGNKVICHNCLFEHFVAEERFDTIVAAHILEHIDDPIALLKQSRGWLKDDGSVIIVVPNAGSLHRRIGKQMAILKDTTQLSESDKFLEHRRVYTLEALTCDIIKSGLKVIRTGGLTLKPLSNAQMEEWPDDLLNALFEIGKEIPPDLCGQLYAIATLRG